MIFAGAMTATAVVAGGIAALAAGIALLGGGLVIAGIAAASLAVGVISALVYFAWDDFVLAGKAAVEALKGVGSALSGLADTVIAWVSGLPQRMWNALTGAAPSETGAVNDPEAQSRRSANGGSAGRARAAAGGFYGDAGGLGSLGLDTRDTDILGRITPPADAGQAPARPMSYLPLPPTSGSGDLHASINLDGRAVYQGVIPYLARDATRPSTGSACPDPSMSPYYPGASFA